MAEDLHPEEVLKTLEEGRLAPFYLFYGPEEFRLEKVLDRIRQDYVPEPSRDLNLEIFYGDETDPGEIVNHALSMPFLAPHRLIIVRRTESFTADQLEKFLRYLEGPSESTCLIFVASRTDFKKRFFKKLRASGRAVNFSALKENQIVPWIKGAAAEMGLKIETQACVYLRQVVGNGLRDLYGELEKLLLRHGGGRVGVHEVRELVIQSRIFTIFELMNVVSVKNCSQSLRLLNRFLEEEDKKAGPLKLIGMLNRQLRLLLQTKVIQAGGGGPREVTGKLGIPFFSAKDYIRFSEHWSEKGLERGLFLLYEADGRLKSGSRPKPVLENLFLTLCDAGGLR